VLELQDQEQPGVEKGAEREEGLVQCVRIALISLLSLLSAVVDLSN